jgi:putative copper resistance protein D
MDWFGAGVDAPAIAIRAVHFAATAVVAGSLIFRAAVAGPVLRSDEAWTELFRRQTLRLVWSGLAISVASGVIWLLLQAPSMSGLSFAEAMAPAVLSTVLNETQFGLVFEIRLVLAVVLAGCLVYDHLARSRWLGLAAAIGLIAGIAWTGHGGATSGPLGIVHVAADLLHLVATAAWLGGLFSLVLLLGAARGTDDASISLAAAATRRFSTLGIASVGTLFLTGIVNAWFLVGSLDALMVTEYGRLLTLKVGLFAVMVAFAAINRFWLTPRLLTPSLQLPAESPARLYSLGRLTRNSKIEIVLGLMIYGIVGLLGTLHPAIHFSNS